MHTAKKPTERSRFALHMPVFWIIWHCILPWTNWALSAWLKCASHLVYIPQLQRLNYQCVPGMQISDYPHFPTTLPALHLSVLPNRLPTALLALHSDSYFKFSQPGSPIFFFLHALLSKSASTGNWLSVCILVNTLGSLVLLQNWPIFDTCEKPQPSVVMPSK